jgi:hypothetical protein
MRRAEPSKFLVMTVLDFDDEPGDERFTLPL